MIEQITLVKSAEDFDQIALALGVPRYTLPTKIEQRQVQPPTPWEVALTGYELDEEEWRIVGPLVPRGIAHHARCDRSYVNACLARQRLARYGKSWWYLDPSLGPVSSLRGRYLRWVSLRWFQKLFEDLTRFGGLSSARMAEFENLATEAENRLRRKGAHS
ncbi:transposase [Hyphomicrobium facile]|uniref:Uncharacterized protein n=1 Tax=Hyphomicrobium facile TaxID=51670 RepID=A0A1I7NE54_9HYPH|nr:transposase [Hyphomicrobium facile]SFV32932.1 hypothetical protein SAMN04488557_1777 [Hyphomicrobium facile]